MEKPILTDYIKKRGLTVKVVAQKCKVSKQALSAYGRTWTPTAKTLDKVAKAMTELGAPTTVKDLVGALYE